mmetsp:Transcript_41157/g.81144  ORF Transcript_41157/g.81144 Transcript_41157/m.81144 type:complete len:186 (-) Transcript_41157:758-1315(-)
MSSQCHTREKKALCLFPFPPPPFSLTQILPKENFGLSFASVGPSGACPSFLSSVSLCASFLWGEKEERERDRGRKQTLCVWRGRREGQRKREKKHKRERVPVLSSKLHDFVREDEKITKLRQVPWSILPSVDCWMGGWMNGRRVREYFGCWGEETAFWVSDRRLAWLQKKNKKKKKDGCERKEAN